MIVCHCIGLYSFMNLQFPKNTLIQFHRKRVGNWYNTTVTALVLKGSAGNKFPKIYFGEEKNSHWSVLVVRGQQSWAAFLSQTSPWPFLFQKARSVSHKKTLKFHHFCDSEESCKGEWQQHKRCLQRYFGKTGGGDAFVNSFLRMYLMSSLGEDIYLILFEVNISSFLYCPFRFIEVRSTVALNILWMNATYHFKNHSV